VVPCFDLAPPAEPTVVENTFVAMANAAGWSYLTVKEYCSRAAVAVSIVVRAWPLLEVATAFGPVRNLNSRTEEACWHAQDYILTRYPDSARFQMAAPDTHWYPGCLHCVHTYTDHDHSDV